MAELPNLAESSNMKVVAMAVDTQHSTVQQNNFSTTEATKTDTEVKASDNLEPVKIVSEDDQKMLYAVLQFLKKNNLAKTVDALEKETEQAGGMNKFMFSIEFSSVQSLSYRFFDHIIELFWTNTAMAITCPFSVILASFCTRS